MLVLALVAVASSAAVEGSRRWLVRRAVVDVPSDRSSHGAPTVRGAGLGVAAGLIVGWTLADGAAPHGWLGLPVLAFGFGAIGFVEDVWRDRPIAIRLGGQLVVGAIAARLLLADTAQTTAVILVLTPIVIAWSVAVVNLANFMDGINGITALTAMAAAASIALMVTVADPSYPHLVTSSMVLFAALLGFLPHNFPTARVFLGDTGSYLVGGALAGLVVVGARSGLPVVAVAAPLVPYLADAVVTLGRRVLRGDTWWEPHREHTYQRLVWIHGWSHARSAGAMAMATLLAASGGVLVAAGVAGAPLAAVSAWTATSVYLLLPTVLRRRARSSTTADD